MVDKKQAEAATEFADIIPRALEEELVAKHGPGLRAVRTVAGPVVMKRVKRDTYKRFRSMLFNEKTRADAGEWLARAACVHPDGPALLAMMDEYPGIASKMSSVALELCGSDEDAEEKAIGT